MAAPVAIEVFEGNTGDPTTLTAVVAQGVETQASLDIAAAAVHTCAPPLRAVLTSDHRLYVGRGLRQIQPLVGGDAPQRAAYCYGRFGVADQVSLRV